MYDAGRTPTIWSTYDKPEEALADAADSYAPDLWADHPRVEVWAEKDAAQSILRPVAGLYQCSYQSTRGYAGLSPLSAAVDRNDEHSEDWTVV